MKILALDIETAPNICYTWGLYNQNISINQIDKPGYTMCWAAKWLDEDRMQFSSVRKDGDKMIQKIHGLLDKADAVLSYNGLKFDLPTLNREFLVHGLPPPSPYRHIDLYQVAKRQFRFVSNKLDWIVRSLGLGEKVKHQGHDLWTACMAGDKEAWRLMEEYNRGDVELLISLYEKMLPWCDKHPSYAALEGVQCCPKCGSEEYQHRGFAYTSAYKYRRYECKKCHGWFRGNKTVNRLPAGEQRMVNIV